MGWKATLTTAEREVGSWNYTHNTNSMIHIAYEIASGIIMGTAWWKRLDGTTGADGAGYLSQIIRGLESDPRRFRLANPPNGWDGDYDGLLSVLREMHDTVPPEPSVWAVSD